MPRSETLITLDTWWLITTTVPSNRMASPWDKTVNTQLKMVLVETDWTDLFSIKCFWPILGYIFYFIYYLAEHNNLQVFTDLCTFVTGWECTYFALRGLIGLHLLTKALGVILRLHTGIYYTEWPVIFEGILVKIISVGFGVIILWFASFLL